MKKKNYFFAAGIFWAMVVIVTVNIIAGKNNYGMEGDEVFSYISANSMGGFKGICFLEDQTWYEADYFKDALTATGEERFNIEMVVENQAMDTHPPLFYLLLNFVCSVFTGKFSKWFGIGLNIFFLVLLGGDLYLLLQYFLNNKYMSLFLSMVFCCSRLTVNMVLFVRMYVILMTLVVFQAWFHLKLYDRMTEREGEFSIKQHFRMYLGLSCITLMGALTHYYFFIYQFFLTAVFVFELWKYKKYKDIFRYIATMSVSGMIYLCLYPAVLNHVFFKYRGRDAVHKFLKGETLFGDVISMFSIFDEQLFKRTLLPLLLLLTGVTIFFMLKKKVGQTTLRKGSLLVLPAVIYFYIVSKASPFVTVRYVSPVAPVLYAALAVWAGCLIRHMNMRILRRWGNVVICAVVFLTSFYFFSEPIKEPYFRQRKDLMDSLAKKVEYCVYITGDEYNWKMWEDYIIYPQFKGLFFIDGRHQEVIEDEKLKEQEQLVVFLDSTLDYEEIIAYLENNLSLRNYEVVYQTPYTYIIRAS